MRKLLLTAVALLSFASTAHAVSQAERHYVAIATGLVIAAKECNAAITPDGLEHIRRVVFYNGHEADFKPMVDDIRSFFQTDMANVGTKRWCAVKLQQYGNMGFVAR